VVIRSESGGGRAGAPHNGAWLAVETATPTGSVAIWKDGLAFEQTLRIQGTASELLMPSIEHALAATDTSPGDISGLVVGSGPGSFTGVRVGASLAKGWAMARGTPLYAYSSLLAVAAGSGVVGPVCPMFDARRRQVYAACYDMSAESVSELLAPQAWYVEDLIEEIVTRDLQPVFTGEGVAAYSDALLGAFGSAVLLPEHLGVPRAGSLLWLSRVVPELGRVNDPARWEPLYVRDWRVPEELENR
jgi:tRNA threonylcarbamoyladenosine biosynthesis protein TsaB